MKNKQSLLSAPYLVWMVIFTVVPLAIVMYYAFTTRTGEFTLANLSLMSSVYQVAKLYRMLVLSRTVTSNSLRLHGLQPARVLCPWDSPGKNTGVGCHTLLQGIFPTQGSDSVLLHYKPGSSPVKTHITFSVAVLYKCLPHQT